MAKASTKASTKAGPKAKARSKSKPGSNPQKGNRVAVLGGGISGMVSALKLARAGFDVTIYEMHERLGGNTSSRIVKGTEHDVYPHMFCAWYENFWHLYSEELGLDRDAAFTARHGSQVLQKGTSEYKELLNPTSIEAAIKNMKSGVLSPAEMWLLGYAGLDLAAHPFDRNGTDIMEMLSVNGFIFSRGYGTENVAAMEDYLLTLIWSIPSAWTAAATYQNFLRHSFTFPNHAPFNYLMTESLEDGLIAPFVKKLEEAGCKIRLKTEITAVRLDDDDRPKVFSRSSIDSHLEHDSLRLAENANEIECEKFDYAVMALPVEPMCDIILGEAGGRSGARIIDRVPKLARMQMLGSVSIPVVDLYLKRKLDDFPSDHIALAGSKYGLTALDISQLWQNDRFDGKTALVLAASQGASIPSIELERQGELILKEFHEFFADKYPDLNLGEHWGDTDSDIDWNRSWIRSNRHYKLFLNDTGSWENRPKTLYQEELPRVVFAGDCARSDVDMATVEGAIQGGTQAAAAIQAQDALLNGHAPRGELIKLVPHTVYSTATFRGANLFYLPATYLAYTIAAFEQWKKRMEDGDHKVAENQFTMAEYVLLIPLQFTIDWWKAAYWFGRALIGSDNRDPFGGRVTYLPTPLNSSEGGSSVQPEERVSAGDDDDHVIGLPEAILMVAREVYEFCSGQETGKADKNAEKKPDEPIDLAVDIACDVIEGAFAIGDKVLSRMAARRPQNGAKYQRRWRTKR